MASTVNLLPTRDVLQDYQSRDYLLYADQILNSMLAGNPAGINNKNALPRGGNDFSVPFYGLQDLPTDSFQWMPIMEREPVLKQLRLCVKVPALGSFYLFAESNKRVADLIPNIELKVYELYRTFICVHKLQTEEGMDMPLSCAVGSVLQDHSLVSVQYARTAEAFSPEREQPLSPSYFPQEYPVRSPPREEVEETQTYRQGVKFRDAPPTKVIQNKEFSFSVSAKNLPFVEEIDPYAAEDQMLHYDNVWGAPVPLPRGEDSRPDAIPICSADRGDVPYDIIIEEEGGGVLHSRDFSVRSSVLDKKRGLFVFFVKIKKNSHYGRTRFIIKVKERKLKKRIAKDSRDHNGGYEQLDGLWARELLASAPIVVVSKERKANKRKKNKDETITTPPSTL